MASKRILILLSLLTLSSFNFKSSLAGDGGLAISWGQNNGDGSLTSTCDTGNFDIVMLHYLVTFGCGKAPELNLAGHCGDVSTPCVLLQREIHHCQNKGVKVFLSLGGVTGSSLCSAEDAKEVATYLYDNFLSGQNGPLGRVTLDGIDFDVEGSRSNLYWDDLVKELDSIRNGENKKHFYLSAAPQCVIPDFWLAKAIQTGLFDHIFVRFYNNPSCQYSSNGDTFFLFRSWDAWTSIVHPNNSVSLGLPASPNTAPSGGYIPPQVLTSKVLPFIKETSNYGGVALWTRLHDLENQPHPYSEQISNYVPRAGVPVRTTSSSSISEAIAQCMNPNVINEAISECVWAALNRKSSSH